MGKAGKIIIITITSLIILVGSGIIGLITFIDPNQYKTAIFSIVEKQTGAQLYIDKIRWGIVGSNLGLVANNISIITNPQNSSTPLAIINEAELGLNLTDLLHKKITINKLILGNANFTLVKNGNLNNWQLSDLSKNQLEQNNYILNLQSIKIINSSISYSDILGKHDAKLTNLNLSLKTYDSGSISYYMKANFLNVNKVAFEINQIINGNLDFTYSDGHYNGNLATQQFSLPSLASSLGINNLPPIAKSNQLEQIALTASFNGSTKDLNISNALITTPDSNINFKTTINSFSPLSGFSALNIDKADVADYLPLKGYRLKIRNMTSQGNFTERNNKLTAEQDVSISNLTLYGYNLHSLSVKIATILSNPLKIISIPETISQIQNSIAAANSNGTKNLNLVSNLGSLSSHVSYSDTKIENQHMILSGPDLRANATGSFNTNKRYLDYQINAQFVAAPNTLTGKIIYPVSVNGSLDNPQNTINWSSVNKQIAQNLGGSLINTGKDVGKATGSTMEQIGNKIKNWF